MALDNDEKIKRRKESHKKWYAKNKDKEKIRNKTYRKENRDEILRKYEENKEFINAKLRERYKKNKGKRKEYHKAWHQKNKVRINLASKKWYQENKEIMKLYHKNYREKHRALMVHYAKIRRAIKKGAEGSHTLQEWELLKKQYGYICPCCGEMEPNIKLTEDHIIPLSKGGSNYIDNIQPLCNKCNSKKHTKTIKY